MRAKFLIMLNILLTQELNNFSPKNFAKLTQANLMSKVDFDNKLISFNRKITSNKTKVLRSSKKQKKSSNNKSL